jgi:dihydrofolate synthase/folylpolyglutamate synthase
VDYIEATQYLFQLRRFGWRPGLDTIQHLLARLGNPQARFPAVHVGGTNGKGSTAAILAAILRAAGRRTALYTSPHLVSFTERMQVDGEPIAEAEVAKLTGELRALCAVHFPPGGSPPHPTFFEIATAMAFQYFCSRGVEAAVVEVGLGGRLDATNVLQPLAAVITNVSLEHQEYLGATVAEIAREKAGIVKPGVPVLCGAAGEPLAVIREVAAGRGAPLLALREAYTWTLRDSGLTGQRFDLAGPVRRYEDLRLPLAGGHQVENAVAAVAAAETLEGAGLGVTAETIRRGLERAVWPGRLQVLQERPRVLLDGAHNPAGVDALVAFLEAQRATLGRLTLVFGVLQGKDARAMLARLAPFAERIILTRPPTDRAADPHALARVLGGPGSVRVAADVPAALALARDAAGEDGTVLVTGSLYTVGAALDAGNPLARQLGD